MVRAKNHGGVREGTPGDPKPNRTDMNSAIPIDSAPSAGREWGAVTADLAAQRVVPMAPPPGPQPGELTPLNAPSERPHEPITTGISLGEGPGPESLRFRTPQQQQPSSPLEMIAQQTNDPYLLSLLKRPV